MQKLQCASETCASEYQGSDFHSPVGSLLDIVTQISMYTSNRQVEDQAKEKERELHKRKSTAMSSEHKRLLTVKREKDMQAVLSVLKDSDELLSTGMLTRVMQFERSYTYKLMVYLRDQGLVMSQGDERRLYWGVVLP